MMFEHVLYKTWFLNQGNDQLCHVQEGGQPQNWRKSAMKRWASCVHQQQHFHCPSALHSANVYLLFAIFASVPPDLPSVALSRDDNQSGGFALKGQRCWPAWKTRLTDNYYYYYYFLISQVYPLHAYWLRKKTANESVEGEWLSADNQK